jgi:ribosomal protein S6--L-glutamate ligase
MNKKILIMTMSENQSRYETERVIEEAAKMGIVACRGLYRELSFNLVNGASKVFWKGEELGKKNLLGVWFRVAGTKSGKYVLAKDMLIKLLKDEVFCVNSEGYLRWQRMGKILQYMEFVEAGIPVVPTKIFYTVEQAKMSKIGDDFGWPIIAKHEKGFQGKSVRKLKNEDEMLRFLDRMDEKNLGMFLWQKYLPTKWDLRVIVLEGKVLGSMKRSATGTEFRSNYSLGGEVEKWDLSKEDGQLAERVAALCGLDYCGVDIMKDQKGKSYVLEVNRQCQFKGFEESTGINVAKKVVEMIY